MYLEIFIWQLKLCLKTRIYILVNIVKLPGLFNCSHIKSFNILSPSIIQQMSVEGLYPVKNQAKDRKNHEDPIELSGGQVEGESVDDFSEELTPEGQ